MKENEIEEAHKLIGNKLIAEFMDYVDEYHNCCKYSKSWFDELKYHLSWDCLMPVVEKIENLDIRGNGYDFPKVKFMGDHCEIFAYATFRGKCFYWKPYMGLGGSFHNHDNQFETKIQAVWSAVVKFIEWYNKQK